MEAYTRPETGDHPKTDEVLQLTRKHRYDSREETRYSIEPKPESAR